MAVAGSPGNPVLTPSASIPIVDPTTGKLTFTGMQLLQQLASALNRISPLLFSGTGSPEGVVMSNPGAIYLNQSGGADTTLYVKESGDGNTGWTAK